MTSSNVLVYRELHLTRNSLHSDRLPPKLTLLMYINLFRRLRLDLSKLPERRTRGKQLIDLFQAPSFQLGDHEERNDYHNDIEGTVDEANFAAEVGVWGFQQVWCCEGGDEGG